MQLYIDSANLDEIKQAVSTGLIDGVTTNPSLIAKEGKEFTQELRSIATAIKKNKTDFTISAEITETTSQETMLRQARKLAKIDKHIIIKVPLTKQGLLLVQQLRTEKIRTNVTLCFSANQALLAAKAGAWCVSPFVGRINDEGYNGIELVEDIRKLYDRYGFQTKILAASIRTVGVVSEVAQAGADIATMPYSVFKKMFYNPLTTLGLEKFENDWKTYQQNKK